MVDVVLLDFVRDQLPQLDWGEWLTT